MTAPKGIRTWRVEPMLNPVIELVSCQSVNKFTGRKCWVGTATQLRETVIEANPGIDQQPRFPRNARSVTVALKRLRRAGLVLDTDRAPDCRLLYITVDFPI